MAINHTLGGGLVRSFEPSGRPVWVHLVRLKEALERDPDARAAELDYIESRVEKLEQSTAALKNAHRQLKRRLDASDRPRVGGTPGDT